MTVISEGKRSVVERIAPNKIKKTYGEGYEEDFKREVKALGMLSKYEHFPKLLEVGDYYIVMTYVGEQTRRRKKGLRAQALGILRELEEAGIHHQDAGKTHFTELNGILHLIDFGSCGFKGEKNPFVTKSIRKGLTDRDFVDKLFKR